jgi:hypothetical protein
MLMLKVGRAGPEVPSRQLLAAKPLGACETPKALGLILH